MDNQDKPSQEQKDSLQESLNRGQAFETTIRTEGWGYIKAYYQAKIQQFASSLLVESGKPISEFEDERRELIGLRKLLGMVENDIQIYEENDKKNKPVTAK